MKKLYLPLAVLAMLFVASCTGDRVTILSFSPTEEVERLTTFEVQFSEDIAPADSIGEWMDGDYLTFEPAIQGKYKWLTGNTLLFSPEAPLQPGQDYEATVNKSVLGESKKKGDFDSYAFHTPYFDAERVEFFWTQVPRSDYKVTVQANLYFNYEVDPKEVAEYLQVKRGGSEMKNFDVVTTEPASVIAVNFGQVQQTEKDQDFEITIESGLGSTESAKAMTDDRSFSVTLDALTRLAITSVASGVDGNKGWIEVFTTQAVDDEVVKRFVEVDPRKSFSVTTSSNSFRLEGDFKPGSMLNLAIKKGLPGLYGGQLEDGYTQEVVMADLSPQLEFTDENGQYLMRGGQENIQVRAVNVPKVDVKVYEVFANNLLFYLYNKGGGYYYDNCCGVSNGFRYTSDDAYEGDDYDDYYYDDYYYYGADVGNYGRLLHEEEVELGEQENKLNEFTVDVGDHFDERFGGIYVVEVRDERDYWRKDIKVISISDLGIIAKRSADELLVFVNSIRTTEPLSGIQVSLVSTNNQPLVTGTTDDDGMIRFTDLKAKTKGFTPRMITAVRGKEFNFVDFKDTKVELSRYDVGGKREFSDSYETFIYADRNLFRPGETAHFNTLIRDKQMGVVKDLPVGFKVINPRGRIFRSVQKTLGDQGDTELTLDLPNYAATGDYTLEAYSGTKDLLGTYSFSVEEFVPDKIRVEAESNIEGTLGLGEKLNVDIFSEYLFGAPCSDHAYEVDINLNHAPYRSKKYPKFSFYPRKVDNEYLSNDLETGKLDAEGKDQFTWTAPSSIEAAGIVRGRAFVTVFDATGRTVTRQVPFKLYPSDYFIGVDQGSYYVSTGSPLNVKAVAVSPQDKALSNFRAQVEVVRFEWRTVLKKNRSGEYTYQSERKEIVEESKSLTLNGVTNYVYTPQKSGRYEVRFRKAGQERYSTRTFYAYGSRSTTRSSFAVDREGRIEIVPDKEKYEPGETAKLLFKTPFSGKMLVTVERENVLEHRYLAVENNSAELELPITGEHLPNVFVSATLIRPHQLNAGTPFFVGHGFQPLLVEASSNRLPVEIQSPERIKPRRTQEIVIKTAPSENVRVTLAMVDEGILQIKNYKTPDPYAFMYAKRKLSVSSYDLYEMLMEEVQSMNSSMAGGDEMESGKRINPITAQRFKLLSFWSGTRRSSSSGEVRIKVPVPQFNGAARLMAVAYSDQRFGSAEKMMMITDDVVVMPAVPRFLSPKDSVVLPVSLLNTTAQAGKVTVNVATEGPIKVSSAASQSVQIAGKGNANVKFGLQVGDEVGKGKITIRTSGMDKVLEEIEIAVRPTSPLVVESGVGILKAGASKSIQLPTNFVDGTQRTSLSIAKFPALQYADQLSSLVRYPHGCVEQTTSKLFPQLYFEELAAAVAPDMYVNGNPVYFVKEGVRKLQSMQLSDGSLSYWPGGSYSSWWGSAYAAHFLTEAQKAGYDVSESMMNKLYRYLAREAAEKKTYQYSRYRSGSRSVEIKAHKEVLYSLYVLALADRADLSLMNYYRARPHLLTTDTRYLLAGAFGLENDWNAFNELMPGSFSPEVPERESGGSFDSPVRANAIMLSVLTDVDPDNKQIPGLIKWLTNPGRRVYSTQDKSWTFLALGKAASKNSRSQVKVDISVSGKSTGTYNNQPWSFQSDLLKGNKVNLNANGSGQVYYFWSVEGVKKGGDAAVEEVDNNIRVRRRYFDRDGNEITSGRVKQGELIVCEIELGSGLRGAENIAISDLIPAGFEIDNPRLGTSTALSWMKNTLYPQYVDVRDDRLLVFTSIGSNESRKYHYMLRAVNAGLFKAAPIGAEAMYDPDFRSYNGGGFVRIDPR